MASSDGRSLRAGILKQDSQEQGSPSYSQTQNSFTSPKGTPKTVSIAPHHETISPLILGKQKSVDELELGETRLPRRPAVKQPSNRRLSGRLNVPTSEPKLFPSILDGASAAEGRQSPESEQHQSHSFHSKHVDTLVEQVSTWLKEERTRRSMRRARRADRKSKTPADPGDDGPDDVIDFADADNESDSDAAVSLNKLESILKAGLGVELHRHRKPSFNLRHRPSLKKLHSRKASTVSDDGNDYSEFFGDDILVPACDAVLDNTKTLSYPTTLTDLSDDSAGEDDLARTASYRDKDAWSSFKFEILRSIHTLRLKGWRKVPLDLSDEISVERLSGALTNSVYVVAPPDELPPRQVSQDTPEETLNKPRKPPPKLLLRIYGPQVEHLIDRESELQILKRLARQNIGPRLLGTFENGRFEEYLYAKPLTPVELRNPDTSRQIAKRMRELHDGIELLEEERDAGPFVWRNWDKWVQRVGQVVTWLDDQIKMQDPKVKPTGENSWIRRGLICGAEWEVFKKAVEKHRAWLETQYGGTQKIIDQLVFAHNDTQYGNILRVIPTTESPLLLPTNSHKQLVVIDFEYANANLPGQEFANHFTEWCYDYHDEKRAHVCDTDRYPTPEEQIRFLKSYLRHQSQSVASTPTLGPSTPTSVISQASDRSRKTASMITGFIAEARNPRSASARSSPQLGEQPDDILKNTEEEDMLIARLRHEIRMWRLANSAQWVAWGIVQAKPPGMPTFPASQDSATAWQPLDPIAEAVQEDLSERANEYKTLAVHETAQTNSPDAGAADGGLESEAQDEEFDYLGYSQHRAMFFWGDAIQLGLVELEDLPVETRDKVKTVPY